MNVGDTIVQSLFFVSFFLLAWVFGIYPLVLMFIRTVRGGARIQKATYFPPVTVMVPTYQEANVVERRIQNIFESDYPHDKLEVLIVDSASTDGTAEVVKRFIRQYPDKPVRVIEEDVRRGKVAAINAGLQVAQREIIIVTDGPTLYEPDTIRHVTSNFADPRVGAVTGRFGFPKRDTEVNHAEGMAWDFKNVLRQLEGDVDSTSFVSGELCAFRKSLISDLGQVSADDSYVAYRTRQLGYRVVAEPKATYYEKKPASFSELQMQKTKSATVGMIESWRFRHMLLRPRYGLFGLLIFPTKLLFSPLSPFLLILSVLTGIAWLGREVGFIMLASMAGFILLGSLLIQIVTGKNIFKAGLIFLFNEWIILRSFFKWVSGNFDVRWEKAASIRD